MKTVDVLIAAWGALAGGKLRTLLTLLGIVIGAGCVVSMAAIGQGAQAKVADEIKAFGANVLLVNPAQSQQNGVSGGRRHTLADSDATEIAKLPTVAAAAASVYGTVQLVAGRRNWSTTVNGTTSDHFAVRRWGLADGRRFSREDEVMAAKVAVIGKTVAAKLFGDEDPVGRLVRVMDTPFTVVGVLNAKGASPAGDDQDDVVFVPLATARIRLIGGADSVNHDAVAYIIASAVSAGETEAAMADIRALLRERHRIEGEDDFTVTTAASVLKAQQSSARTIALLLGSVAAISLIVGGISIMNIMLVSVTERTREIGLRIAIGARPRDVQRQFLAEAAALGLTGGAAGVALGAACALAVGRSFGWPVLIEPATAASALALAGGLGAAFGWYPARRAARLQPVEALRSG